MSKITVELKSQGIEAKAGFSIKKLTTFKIGGKVDVYAVVKNVEELKICIKILKKHKKRYMIVGSFSNVLIKDGRVNLAFVVLKGKFEKITVINKNTIYAGAGATNRKLIKFLAENKKGGLEFLTGIPGTFGGAVYMNAGAFGCGVGTYIKYIDVVDKTPKQKKIKNIKGVFAYRKSIFEKNGNIITGAAIKVKPASEVKIKKEMKRISDLRRGKHPWQPSAGSVFKNRHPKYIAGKLIDEAGMKGVTSGGAAVSEKHGNFIINTGRAKFSDVTKLINIIKRKVYKKHGVKLEEEIRIIR